MLDLASPFRRATPDDADAMVAFVDMAGEGLPLHLWSQMAEPGEDPWDVGRARARREEGSFSYRNAVMLDDGGGSVACLIGYPLSADSKPIDHAKMPAMFVPMQELENLAPATWYVNVLATDPALRGNGYGTRLLALADKIASEAGLRGLSIIVNDANVGARRLYERNRYRESARRPMMKEGWKNPGENWLLLVKDL